MSLYAPFSLVHWAFSPKGSSRSAIMEVGPNSIADLVVHPYPNIYIYVYYYRYTQTYIQICVYTCIHACISFLHVLIHQDPEICGSIVVLFDGPGLW